MRRSPQRSAIAPNSLAFPASAREEDAAGFQDRVPLFMDEETRVDEYVSPVDEPNGNILRSRYGLNQDSFRWHETQPRGPTEIKGTYSSLPSSPAVNASFLRSPSPRREELTVVPMAPAPFSLWDYLREEMLATDFDSHQELKWERVSNFLSVPLAIEKV